MNKITLIGNLTCDTEIDKTKNDTAYSRFTIAVHRKYVGSDGKRVVDFIPITAWGGLADLVFAYLSKGKKVCIVGRLQTRTYEKNGVKVGAYEIVAEEIEFLSARNKGHDNDKK